MMYKCNNPKCVAYNVELSTNRLQMIIRNDKVITSALCTKCGNELLSLDEIQGFPTNFKADGDRLSR